MHPVAEFVPVLSERSELVEVVVRTDEPSFLRGILSKGNQAYDYHSGYSFVDRGLSIGDLNVLRFRLHILDFLNCHCCYFRYHGFVRDVFQLLMARVEDVMDL